MNQAHQVLEKKKNVLIISYGPVPTPEYQKIEGGGMRCWGLAKGLQSNDISVTVAVNADFPQSLSAHQEINLINWQLNEEFSTVLNSFDAVLVSYSMGDLSVFVADQVSEETLLILDAYVPIYVEVLARDAADIVNEYANYQADIARHNHVLRRGDYFLCANEPQRHMYTGILGSLGILNPYTYKQNRLLLLPFGIEESYRPAVNRTHNPYDNLGIQKSDFIVLWFGGLYSWFDFSPLIEAIKKLAATSKTFKFVLVGGKNPYNDHPDFTRQYTSVHNQLEAAGLVDSVCHFVDWVDFDSRIDWFMGADLVISINRSGDENTFSWRTRVMDYVWGSVPMLTNGGDPLSDFLIEKKAALSITMTSENIAAAIANIQNNPSELAHLKESLNKVRKRFFWPRLTKELAEKITNPFRPFKEELHFTSVHGLVRQNGTFNQNTTLTKSRFDSLRRTGKLIKKVREKGIMRSGKFAISIVQAKVKHVNAKVAGQSPKAVFISHPIDDSGAPLVLLQIADDFRKAFPPKRIVIAAPHISKHLLRQLIGKRYLVQKITEFVGKRTIEAQLNIQPDDFVLLNTVAVLENYRHFIFGMLERGTLPKATWFIHEDKPAIRLTNKIEVGRIKRLLAKGSLTIRVPSEQTAAEYNDFLQTDSVSPVKLRVDVDDKYKNTRTEENFREITFVISGTASDGRKGQLLFLAALAEFESTYRSKKISDYRVYSVVFISVSEGDYISDQILAIGKTQLGERFTCHPKLPREEALAIMHMANFTVCVSLNETFGLFVAEGMMMGHVIIRNHSSGWNEQMQNTVNGYLVDDLDVADLAKKINLVLSKQENSDQSLAGMGRESQIIAEKFSQTDYLEQLRV